MISLSLNRQDTNPGQAFCRFLFSCSSEPATVVDLRYRMKEVLEALDRQEKVTVLCHGKVKGILAPVEDHSRASVMSHPFFGMTAAPNEGDARSVDEAMKNLRAGRYDAV